MITPAGYHGPLLPFLDDHGSGAPPDMMEAAHYGAIEKVAARYKEKKKIKTKDGEDAVVYVYSDRQVANRNRAKAEKVEHLRKQIGKLREQVQRDLTSKDEHTRAVALAVGLMDATYERVGNDESAAEGHYGVTGWKVKHLTFSGDKVTIKYVGKSGVKHEKVIDTAASVRALRGAIKGKKPDDEIVDCDAEDVNEYLKKFDVTAKDIRGYHANTEMQNHLKAIRSKGGKLPTDPKERKKKLKAEFRKALEMTADAVGHEPSTLKSHYLVPGLEEEFLKDGTVSEKLTKKGKTASSNLPFDAWTPDAHPWAFCPVCHEKYTSTCRCTIGHKTCPNGHQWVWCRVHDKAVALPEGVDPHMLPVPHKPDFCRCRFAVKRDWGFNMTASGGLKVFLDDERPTPPGWVHARWPEDVIRLLKTGRVEEISLDHDLGDDRHGTGYDVILWIEEAVATRGFNPPRIRVHSANPSARQKMEAGIRSIERFRNRTAEEVRFKYPRTPHLPWSPGSTSDDRILTTTAHFNGKIVVVTEKMDGENCTIGKGYTHARSLDSPPHESRNWVRGLAGRITHELPDGWRLCGENMYARHSIPYDALPSYFLLFSVWDEHNNCLSWDETEMVAEMLGIHTVPVLYKGPWDEKKIAAVFDGLSKYSHGGPAEGYVVRTAGSFPYSAFDQNIAKFVRAGHVQDGTDHWMQQKVVPNKLIKTATKTEGEKEEKEIERLVRPAPTKKPPRKDLRRERVKVHDPDLDGDKSDTTKDPDLSLNYKKVAGECNPAPIRALETIKPPRKKFDLDMMYEDVEDLAVRVIEAKTQTSPKQPAWRRHEHKPGTTWRPQGADTWSAKNMKGETRSGFKDEESAKAYATGKAPSEISEEAPDKVPAPSTEPPERVIPKGPMRDALMGSMATVKERALPPRDAEAEYRYQIAMAREGGQRISLEDENRYLAFLMSATFGDDPEWEGYSYKPDPNAPDYSGVMNVKLPPFQTVEGHLLRDLHHRLVFGVDKVRSRKEAERRIRDQIKNLRKEGFVSADVEARYVPVILDSVERYHPEWKASPQAQVPKPSKAPKPAPKTAPSEDSGETQEQRTPEGTGGIPQESVSPGESPADTTDKGKAKREPKPKKPKPKVTSPIFSDSGLDKVIPEDSLGDASVPLVNFLLMPSRMGRVKITPEVQDRLEKAFKEDNPNAKPEEIKHYIRAISDTIGKPVLSNDLVEQLDKAPTEFSSEVQARQYFGRLFDQARKRGERIPPRIQEAEIISRLKGVEINPDQKAPVAPSVNLFSDMEISDDPNEPPEKGIARATKAFNKFSEMEPDERKAAAVQIKAELGKTKEGTPRYNSLMAIADGLRVASVLNDDEWTGNEGSYYYDDDDIFGGKPKGKGKIGPIVPKASEMTKALIKGLYRTGKVDILFQGKDQGIFAPYPDNKETLHEAVGALSDYEVFQAVGGVSGPYRAIIEAWNDPNYSVEERIALSNTLRDCLVVDMGFLYQLGEEASAAANQAKTKGEEGGEPPKSGEEFVKRVNETPEVRAVVDKAKDDCKGALDPAACAEAAKAEIRQTKAKAAVDLCDEIGFTDKENPLLVQAAVTTSDPSAIDAEFRLQEPKEKEEGGDQKEPIKPELRETPTAQDAPEPPKQKSTDNVGGKEEGGPNKQKKKSNSPTSESTSALKVASLNFLKSDSQSFVYKGATRSGGADAARDWSCPSVGHSQHGGLHMARKLTKKGALAVTADLDRIANLFQFDHHALGIPKKIAMDFAYRADLLSDQIMKNAGIEPASNGGFPASTIGVERGGPLEQDTDEAWMDGEFTQQENRELRGEQEAGKLGPTPDIGPRAPSIGKQAGFEALGRQAAVRQVIATERTVHEAALSAAVNNRSLVAGLTNLAASLMRLQANIISGNANANRVASVLNIVSKVMPHVVAVDDETDEEDVQKVARMINLALRTAKKAEEDDDEDAEKVEETEEEKEEEGKEAKKAKKSARTKKSEDDDEDDDNEDEDDEGDVEEPSKGKKAHGYNLYQK